MGKIKICCLFIALITTVTSCNFNPFNYQYYKSYEVKEKRKEHNRYDLYLENNESVNLDTLIAYSSFDETEQITTFHIGDIVTFYYSDSNFQKLKKVIVNKVEIVELAYMGNIFGNSYLISNYKEYSDYTINITYPHYIYYLDGTFDYGEIFTANQFLYATFQIEDCIDKTINPKAYYSYCIFTL